MPRRKTPKKPKIAEREVIPVGIQDETLPSPESTQVIEVSVETPVELESPPEIFDVPEELNIPVEPQVGILLSKEPIDVTKDLGVPLPAEESMELIEKLMDTLSLQELSIVRDLAEEKRKEKREGAKAAIIEETERKLIELGFTLNDVFTPQQRIPPRRGLLSKQDHKQAHKRNPSSPIKYRGPSGETWTGKGPFPKWLKQLEDEGHNREEFAAEAPIGSQTGI
jgi:DNA-binding protein H-NS